MIKFFTISGSFYFSGFPQITDSKFFADFKYSFVGLL